MMRRGCANGVNALQAAASSTYRCHLSASSEFERRIARLTRNRSPRNRITASTRERNTRKPERKPHVLRNLHSPLAERIATALHHKLREATSTGKTTCHFPSFPPIWFSQPPDIIGGPFILRRFGFAMRLLENFYPQWQFQVLRCVRVTRNTLMRKKWCKWVYI